MSNNLFAFIGFNFCAIGSGVCAAFYAATGAPTYLGIAVAVGFYALFNMAAVLKLGDS